MQPLVQICPYLLFGNELMIGIGFWKQSYCKEQQPLQGPHREWPLTSQIVGRLLCHEKPLSIQSLKSMCMQFPSTDWCAVTASTLLEWLRECFLFFPLNSPVEKMLEAMGVAAFRLLSQCPLVFSLITFLICSTKHLAAMPVEYKGRVIDKPFFTMACLGLLDTKTIPPRAAESRSPLQSYTGSALVQTCRLCVKHQSHFGQVL